MPNTWLIVANACQANLYNASLHINGGSLQLLKGFTHPESRQKSSDLNTDRSGNFQRRGEGTGSYNPTINPKETESERFAHELVQTLKTGRATNSYSDLILVAPPHFLGLLRKAMNDQVHDCIKICVEKDYTHIPSQELATRVRERIYA